MADEPSMDEILASLDRLLKEGEGRNDEPAEPLAKTPGKEQAEERIPEPDPGFLAALDEATTEPSYVSKDSGPQSAEKAGNVGGKPVRTAAAQPGPAAPAVPRRIVLTDAMMVDDVQQSLPMRDAAPAGPGDAGSADPKPEPAVAGPAPDGPSRAAAWDARDIQALVDQVTDDVCSAMAEQLPDLIRQALAQRLSSFVVDRAHDQDSDSKD